nr:MAG TPA: YopX protein [Caudoviricetes sp.]
MREILFKAKRIDNSKWVEGYYLRDQYHIGGKDIIFYRKDSDRFTVYTDRIDIETLCQFTGLYDKNGKKIWENDILMAHLDESYPEDATYETVEWGVAGWVTHEIGSTDREYLNEFDLENFEVVGNIFDNPELLQEEHK